MAYCVEFESENMHTALHNHVHIANTLQGSVWRALMNIDGESPKSVVIKVTNETAHNHSIALIDNTVHHIREDIVLEQTILRYLSLQVECSPFIVKFIAFWKREQQFHLVMEDGGNSLFHFVNTLHKSLIREKRIDLSHWKQVVKIICKQMVECIQFVHSKNICHNDISLENFLINDVMIELDQCTGKITFKTDDIRIKLCDFGLAELHTDEQCLSSKYCGKKQYVSPEVIGKKGCFEGKKNDVWSVGICLFMLSFGCPPWKCARDEDDAFRFIMAGGMLDVLNAWGRSTFVDSDCVDLLLSIFKPEKDRISVSEIMKHAFING